MQKYKKNQQNLTSGKVKACLNKSTHLKIKLTDLCFEDKAKIGELITTLQNQKQQNLLLNQNNTRLKQQIQQLNTTLSHLQETLEQQKVLIQQYQSRNKELQKNNKKNSKAFQQLEQKMKNGIFTQAKCSDYSVNTDFNIVVTQGTQTKTKKKRYQQISVQTEGISPDRQKIFNSTGRYHSKSFDKIMGSDIYETRLPYSIQTKKQLASQRQTAIDYAIALNQQDQQQNTNERKKMRAQILNEIVAEEEGQSQSVTDDEEFRKLVKKWFQIKQLSSSGKKHKNKLSISKMQSEAPYAIRLNNQSLNLTSEKQKFKSYESFDQIELNKILKSKNFSASRLINHRLVQQDKRHQLQSRSSLPRSVKHSQNFVINSNTNQFTLSGSRPIDFYETNLVDIVGKVETNQFQEQEEPTFNEKKN